jgi:hypothetical protein
MNGSENISAMDVVSSVFYLGLAITGVGKIISYSIKKTMPNYMDAGTNNVINTSKESKLKQIVEKQ